MADSIGGMALQNEWRTISEDRPYRKGLSMQNSKRYRRVGHCKTRTVPGKTRTVPGRKGPSPK